VGSHGIECGGFLLNIPASTMRTFRSVFVVLVEGENNFERFVTIEADIIVDGHGNLP
jgi:hypothetical protein